MKNVSLALNGSNTAFFHGALFTALSIALKDTKHEVECIMVDDREPSIFIKSINNFQLVLNEGYQKHDNDHFIADESKPMITTVKLWTGYGDTIDYKNQITPVLSELVKIILSTIDREWDIDCDDFENYIYSDEELLTVKKAS